MASLEKSTPQTTSHHTTIPQVQEKRGRGRPSNFPGVKTVTRLYKLPTETVEMIEKLAADRDQPLGVVLDAMIRRAFNEATRKRSARKTEAATAS